MVLYFFLIYIYILMAILHNGLLGGSRKSIGSIVTYSLNGQQVARTKAAHYSDANSPKQLLQRSSFSTIVAFARLILGTIRTSFSNRSQKRSGFNEFVSTNLSNGAIDATTGGLVPSNIVVADGTVLAPDAVQVSFDFVTSNCTVLLVPNANNTTGFSTDDVKFVVYDILADVVYTPLTLTHRADSTHVFNLPLDATLGARELAVYVYASSVSSSSIPSTSPSVYLPLNAVFV